LLNYFCYKGIKLYKFLNLKYMSKTCMVCGRGALNSASRSHSNIKTKRRQNLNLQNKRINGSKVKICTKCLKTMNKTIS